MYVWVPPGLEVSSKIHSEQFLVRFEEADPYTRVQDVYGELGSRDCLNGKIIE